MKLPMNAIALKMRLFYLYATGRDFKREPMITSQLSPPLTLLLSAEQELRGDPTSTTKYCKE